MAVFEEGPTPVLDVKSPGRIKRLRSSLRKWRFYRVYAFLTMMIIITMNTMQAFAEYIPRVSRDHLNLGATEYHRFRGKVGQPTGFIYLSYAIGQLSKLAPVWPFAIGLDIAVSLTIILLFGRHRNGHPATILLLAIHRLQYFFVTPLYDDLLGSCLTWAGIALFSANWWVPGSAAFIAASTLSYTAIPMTPIALLILWQARGLLASLTVAIVGLVIHAALYFPFMDIHWSSEEITVYTPLPYHVNANWRILPVEVYTHPLFRTLLTSAFLLVFVIMGIKWSGGMYGVSHLLHTFRSKKCITTRYVTTAFSSTMIVAALFAHNRQYRIASWATLALPFVLANCRLSAMVKSVSVVALVPALLGIHPRFWTSLVLQLGTAVLAVGVFRQKVPRREVVQKKESRASVSPIVNTTIPVPAERYQLGGEGPTKRKVA